MDIGYYSAQRGSRKQVEKTLCLLFLNIFEESMVKLPIMEKIRYNIFEPMHIIKNSARQCIRSRGGFYYQ